MSLRKQALIVWVLAVFAFGGALTFLVKHAADVDSEHQYLAAPPCVSAAPASGQCYEVTTATVLSKSGGGPNNYNLELSAPGVGHTSEGLAGGDRAAIFSHLTVGGPVSVKVWRQQVTLVLLGNLRAATFRNPTYSSGEDVPAAVALAVLGVVLTVQGVLTLRGSLTVRSKPRDDWSGVPDPELDKLSGPFGMDDGAAVTVTREYGVALGGARATALAVAVIGGSISTAIRIDVSAIALLIGGLVGIALFTAALWIARGTSVVVGPSGITMRRPWGQTTTAWSDVVSARPTPRGLVLRVRSQGFAGGSTRALNLSPFLQSKANASLPRLVALYLTRRPGGFASTDAVAYPAAAGTPSHQQVVAAGFGARLGAWAIDVLTAAVLWFIVTTAVEAVVGIPYGENIPDSLGVAIVFLAIAVTVPTYAILGWRAGRTLGLRLLGLSVVDAKTGSRLSWGRCLLRFVGALPSIVLVIPFGLFMAAGPDRLALHDRIAGSAVVVSGRRRERRAAATALDHHAP